jgi:EpsI family protein
MKRFLATIVLLAATMAAYGLSQRRKPDTLAFPLESVGSKIAGWTAIGDEALSPGVLKKLLPTSYLSRRYRKGSQELDLFISYYAQQRGGEAMHSPKHCLPGGGWEIWQHGSAMVPVNGRQIEVNKYSIQNLGRRMLMFYWYQSPQRIIASEYSGKVYLVWDTFTSGHTAGSIVRFSLPDEPGATEEGVEFAAKAIPEVERCLGGSSKN